MQASLNGRISEDAQRRKPAKLQEGRMGWLCFGCPVARRLLRKLQHSLFIAEPQIRRILCAKRQTRMKHARLIVVAINAQGSANIDFYAPVRLLCHVVVNGYEFARSEPKLDQVSGRGRDGAIDLV